MWLFLPSGFYSVVAHRDSIDPTGRASRVIVRSRERAALEHFAATVAPEHLVAVFEDPRADYPFRAEVPTEVWAVFVRDAAATITATNFKSAMQSRRGADAYVHALHRVWGVLADAFRDQRPR